MNKNLDVKILSLLICLFLTNSLFAGTKFGMNTQFFEPTTDDNRILIVPKAETLGAGQLYLSTFINYVNEPIKISSSNSTKVYSVLDNMITSNYQVGFGLTDLWSLGVSVPISTYDGEGIQKVDGTTENFNFLGIGDITVNSKISIVRPKENRRWGLSLLPYIKIPPAGDRVVISDGTLNYGINLIYNLQTKSNFMVAMTIGPKFRQDKVFIEDVRSNKAATQNVVTYGIALGLRNFIKEGLTLGLNHRGEFTGLSGVVGDENQSPLETLVGLDYDLSNALKVSGGLGIGYGNGIGSGDYRLFAGLGYTFGKENWRPVEKRKPCPKLICPKQECPESTPPEPAPPKPEKKRKLDIKADKGVSVLNIPDTLLFASGKHAISPNKRPELVAIFTAYFGELLKSPESAQEIKSVMVVGHTSPTYGTTVLDHTDSTTKFYKFNRTLSVNRAKEVSLFLTENIFPNLEHAHLIENKVKHEGLSYSSPVFANELTADKDVCGFYDCRKSRRVQIKVMKKQP